jgi:peptidoglycan/LPS O-acetylase OafA/YrhL
MIERKGAKDFIKDRAKRILVPLLAGWPIVMLLIGVAYFLTSLATGVDLAQMQAEALERAGTQPEGGGPQPEGEGDLWNWAHLWFLYYLVLFYVGALVTRAVFGVIDRGGRIRRALDTVVRLVMGGLWSPVVLAAPLAAWFLYTRDEWRSWFGIFPPTDIVPDATALVGHGFAFGLGWLLHRQSRLLLDLEKSWILYGVVALALTVVCVRIAGLTPQWEPYLEGRALLIHAIVYPIASWCWVFAFVGAAQQFLSGPSPTRRYIADSSYWLYLMHLPVLVVFGVVFQALGLHWTIEYTLTLIATMAVLLASYHTWCASRSSGRSSTVGAIRGRCRAR